MVFSISYSHFLPTRLSRHPFLFTPPFSPQLFLLPKSKPKPKFGGVVAAQSINGASSDRIRTLFPGGFKRPEISVPALVLRVSVDEVFSQIAAVSEAVSKGVKIVVLEGGDQGGGRVYEAACALKPVVADRAYFLIADRVDVASAIGASGVVLQDDGIPAIVARNMMMQSKSDSIYLPLVARVVQNIDSAKSASSSEGADFLIINTTTANISRVLEDSADQSVKIPIFFTLTDLTHEESPPIVATKLLNSGASGVAVSLAEMRLFTEDFFFLFAMAIVGYATTGFLPFGTFSTKTSLSQLVLRDRCSILPTRRLWHLKTRALTQKDEEQSLQEDQTGESMDDEIFDEEWQAQQREKTRQWHAYRKKEEEEEERKMDEYREIGMRLKEYPEEDVRKARILVSDFISAAEEVEEKIEEAAERGQLTELVLMVIWNRLDIARRDDERDVIRSLDLLYRRVETEILKRESSPSMRLLNELLNLHDGYDDDGWKKKCRNLMLQTFAREDTFGIIVPAGVDPLNNQGKIELPPEDSNTLFRIDFIREVNDLLTDVQSEQSDIKAGQGFDPESVATRLKQQEKQHTICQVEALLELAVYLKW